jgi:hypothetical protein
VAIHASDPSQKVHTLVEANPDIGTGGQRGAFPASSRTIPASSTPAYLGPYYIVRRTVDGAIDTTFGLAATSGLHDQPDTSYTFTSLCLDPGTGNIVIIGQAMTSSGPVGVVERLIPPARGSGTAALDTSFNPSSSESHTERTRPPVSSGFEKTNGWSRRRLETLPKVTQRRKGFLHLKRHLCQKCSYC